MGEGLHTMQPENEEKLKGFIKHGFVLQGISGSQAFGFCPFSGKDKKLYISLKTLLWDSKVVGLSGNFFKFLEYMQLVYKKRLTGNELKALCEDRELPSSAFKDWEIGWNGSQYTIPIKNDKGITTDIRLFRLGKKIMSTPTCQTGLFGMSRLAKSHPEHPVYVCEGEWDAIAMDWMLRQNGKKATVVGLPGATTFKEEWVYFFKGRNVIAFHDNDEAGENGEHVLLKRLQGVANSIKFIHWLDKFPVGFDVRDFIKLEAVKNKRPRRCYEKLLSMVKAIPRKEFAGGIDSAVVEAKPLPPVDKTINWETLSVVIKKWLKVENVDHWLVAVSTIVSNYVEGDPIWLFVVASPGEGKSELLSSVKHCRESYITSSITPNALISGSVSSGPGREASLLPKLNGKTLVIKDGSAIQNMRETDRESLFGILRDAYDGSAGKDFGTGAHKYFESRFSMLWGMTPSIYQLDSQFSALGERFLKIFIGEYLHHKNQIDVIKRAMGNVGKELTMREELSAAVFSYVENIKAYMQSENYKSPEITKSVEENIAYLAAWCSRMKGTVNRDKFERNVILNKAYAEVGTRTAKQLKRLLLCLPTVIFRGFELPAEYNIIKKVALDTVAAKREDVFRVIFIKCPTKDDTIELGEIIHLTKYSYATVSRTIDDMIALDIVEKLGVKKPFRYTVSQQIREFTKLAGLYEDPVTRNRVSRASKIGD